MSRVADQRVLERVDRRGRTALPKHQARGFEPRQRGLQLPLWKAGYRRQQLVVELSADGRADLSNLPRSGKAVEARQKRALQRRRDRQRRQRAVQDQFSIAFAQQARFEYRLGQFLDEQRHPVGSSGDGLGNGRWQGSAGRAGNQCGGLALGEAVQI